MEMSHHAVMLHSGAPVRDAEAAERRDSNLISVVTSLKISPKTAPVITIINVDAG